MSENLTIGTLAKRGGVNVETIRYYQRRGLLQEPAKPRNGFRHYASDTVKRVRFIKRDQALGFMLEEIIGLLTLDERRVCSETRGIAAHKVELIERRTADLSKMKKSTLSPCAHLRCVIRRCTVSDYSSVVR